MGRERGRDKMRTTRVGIVRKANRFIFSAQTNGIGLERSSLSKLDKITFPHIGFRVIIEEFCPIIGKTKGKIHNFYIGLFMGNNKFMSDDLE